jgi:hypothetical protein
MIICNNAIQKQNQQQWVEPSINCIEGRVSSKEIDLQTLDNFIGQGKILIGQFTLVYHQRHFKPVSLKYFTCL